MKSSLFWDQSIFVDIERNEMAGKFSRKNFVIFENGQLNLDNRLGCGVGVDPVLPNSVHLLLPYGYDLWPTPSANCSSIPPAAIERHAPRGL